MTYTQLLAPAEAHPGNADWHKLRRDGVSASEIAAVLGLSPWESAFSLYHQKVNGWHVDENPEMSAGRRAEQAIVDWYADVSTDGFVACPAGLYVSTARPWQLATPDRLLCDPQMHDNPFPDEWPDWTHPAANIGALLECKYLVQSWDGWGEPGTDEIPVHYRAQALQQLDVLDVDEVQVAAWHGADLRVYRVRRDEKDLRVMRAAGERFMARLAAGEPPPIDDHDATLRTLKALHPALDDRTQTISPATAEGYRRARAMKARAEAQCDRFDARLRAEMGDAARAVDASGRKVASRSIFTVAESVRAAYDVDRLSPARGAK